MRVICFLSFCLVLSGCFHSSSESEILDKEYIRGSELINEGRDSEALNCFLRVIRRRDVTPLSHLASGKIYLDIYNNPIYAMYHFHEFLLQCDNSYEKNVVTQLINTAKKNFLKELPGNNSEIDSRLELIEVAKQLREENISLKRMVKELQNRCKLLENKQYQDTKKAVSSVREIRSNKAKVRYIVQPGDTLSTISRKYYGSAAHWKKIFEANQDKIPYPNALTVGQEIIIP